MNRAALPKHLHAMVAVLNNNDVAVADDCGCPRLVKLAFAAAVAANGAKKEAIGISGVQCLR
jgi:hypothetical protein